MNKSMISNLFFGKLGSLLFGTDSNKTNYGFGKQNKERKIIEESMSKNNEVTLSQIRGELDDMISIHQLYSRDNIGISYMNNRLIRTNMYKAWVDRDSLVNNINYQIEGINKIKKQLNPSLIKCKYFSADERDWFKSNIIAYRKEIVKLLNEKINYFNTYLTSRIKMLEKQKHGLLEGEHGEDCVYNTLKYFDNCKVLRNIRLDVPDGHGEIQSVEMDFVIVMETGVFVLEVKNYASKGQYDLVVDKSGRWTSKYKNGNQFVLNGANGQNNRHIMFLNRFINSKLKFKEYFRANGLTVIGNNVVNIYNESDLQVIKRIDEIYNYVTSFPKILSSEEVNEISRTIVNGSVQREVKYPVPSVYIEVRNNFNLFKNELENYNKIFEDMEMFLQ